MGNIRLTWLAIVVCVVLVIPGTFLGTIVSGMYM